MSLQNIVATPNGDYSARFEMELDYHRPNKPVELSEHRIININRPRDDGSYTIDWDEPFTAHAESATLDRTPLPNEPGGESFGDAGLSIRLAKEAADFEGYLQ